MYLSINGISKSYGSLEVLKNVSFSVEKGEFVALLGPSGCGKTTLLRIIAGLVQPSSGSIRVDGKPLDDVPPFRRDIGMVFQNYALFPHMNVRQNVAFGLRMRKIPKSEITRRVDKVLEMTRLSGLGNRRITELSGGQQQRVALARALVIEPTILLLDEPLSNIDAKLRAQMRVEIAELQSSLGITSIFVTHDQTEAMTMDHRVVVLEDGEILQWDTPANIYNHPRNKFVAEFIGSPSINFINVRAENSAGLWTLLRGNLRLMLPPERAELLAEAVAKGVTNEWCLGIRPEDVVVGSGPTEEGVIATLEHQELLGSEVVLYLMVDGVKITAKSGDTSSVRTKGQSIPITFDCGRIHLFDSATGAALF